MAEIESISMHVHKHIKLINQLINPPDILSTYYVSGTVLALGTQDKQECCKLIKQLLSTLYLPLVVCPDPAGYASC